MVSKNSKSKKVKKNIPFGVAHINSTFNNTIITITDTTETPFLGHPLEIKVLKVRGNQLPLQHNLQQRRLGKKQWNMV